MTSFIQNENIILKDFTKFLILGDNQLKPDGSEISISHFELLWCIIKEVKPEIDVPIFLTTYLDRFRDKINYTVFKELKGKHEKKYPIAYGLSELIGSVKGIEYYVKILLEYY